MLTARSLRIHPIGGPARPRSILGMPATPTVLLFVGAEELLLRRAAERHLDTLRAELGDLEVTDVRGPEVRERGLPDVRTASLFGTPRALLLREAHDIGADAAGALKELVEAGGGDAAVLLLASGTGRIQGLARAVKAAGGRIDVAAPKEWDGRGWTRLVADEFRVHGRSADDAATAAVLGHAGLDVATIAEKVGQVVASAPPGRIGVDAVEAVVVGHGNRGSFAVADAMCDREPARAVELLRGALESGDDPVMVLGALAYRLRSVVAVAGSLDPSSVGLNISAGQARRLQGVRRNFGPGELTMAYRALADADREIKGGELPPAFAIERAVVAVATRASA